MNQLQKFFTKFITPGAWLASIIYAAVSAWMLKGVLAPWLLDGMAFNEIRIIQRAILVSGALLAFAVLFVLLFFVLIKSRPELAAALETDRSIIFVIGTALAVLLRISFFEFESADYLTGPYVWYLKLEEQGFQAFREGFEPYTPAYVYLLYIMQLLFPRMAILVAVKSVAVLFDLICATIVYKIVRLRYDQPSSFMPMLAFFVALFSPTLVMNSSLWGQVDIFYATAVMAAFYLLLSRKEALACLLLGAAFSVKLQGLFLLPLFLALFFKRRVKWTYFLLIPLVYFLFILPSWIAGRSLFDLLTIYFSQMSTFRVLSNNAPNMHLWLPQGLYGMFYKAGLLWTMAILFLYVLVVYKSRVRLTAPILVQLGMVSVFMVPFFLPKMHDRYFFLADILAIVYAFYYPKYFFVPIVIILSSFFAYQPFLFVQEVFPLENFSLALLAVMAVLSYKLLRTLHPELVSQVFHANHSADESVELKSADGGGSGG
jgi:Gpi18-like mannosyltransferase